MQKFTSPSRALIDSLTRQPIYYFESSGAGQKCELSNSRNWGIFFFSDRVRGRNANFYQLSGNWSVWAKNVSNDKLAWQSNDKHPTRLCQVLSPQKSLKHLFDQKCAQDAMLYHPRQNVNFYQSVGLSLGKNVSNGKKCEQ